MVVYSLMKFYSMDMYDPPALLGVFATKADAVAYANTQDCVLDLAGCSDLGIVETTLGAPINLDAIEYLVAE